ncbi:MAG TPA: hypothetical protein VMT50_07250, partial [Steroidobacteraceae bacterium]|nr:hypothetical protein [Steroidobacteraceae bacterium]
MRSPPTRAALVRELPVPPAVLRRLAAQAPQRYPLLLDSAVAGPLSAASVLLALPRAALILGADGTLTGEGMSPQGTTFLGALEAWWRSEATPPGDAHAPLAGGWALYLGYELAQEVEPHLSLPRTPLPWVAFALRTPCALVHELASGRVYATAEAGAGAEEALARLAADALAASAAPDEEADTLA